MLEKQSLQLEMAISKFLMNLIGSATVIDTATSLNCFTWPVCFHLRKEAVLGTWRVPQYLQEATAE